MKPEELTVEELLIEVSKRLELVDEPINKKFERELFSDLAEIDGFSDYLRQTMASDIRRYFSASSDDNRANVKGAFTRTAYLAGLLASVKEANNIKSVLSGGRKSREELQDL